ncbi:hypothetical protein EJ04DRAFT_565890 [Polyplosphaeria fusca]|uniref:Uncharacterized protein n=1 Tax=Polyplosphaeria fusca TaxID=682080 RepID=A0A9P4UXW5_9PLEO|nr:hypothetical protein EJ04DRAFT_565890 [Polyplosphaeria fusca]
MAPIKAQSKVKNKPEVLTKAHRRSIDLIAGHKQAVSKQRRAKSELYNGKALEMKKKDVTRLKSRLIGRSFSSFFKNVSRKCRSSAEVFFFRRILQTPRQVEVKKLKDLWWDLQHLLATFEKNHLSINSGKLLGRDDYKLTKRIRDEFLNPAFRILSFSELLDHCSFDLAQGMKMLCTGINHFLLSAPSMEWQGEDSKNAFTVLQDLFSQAIRSDGLSMDISQGIQSQLGIINSILENPKLPCSKANLCDGWDFDEARGWLDSLMDATGHENMFAKQEVMLVLGRTHERMINLAALNALDYDKIILDKHLDDLKEQDGKYSSHGLDQLTRHLKKMQQAILGLDFTIPINSFNPWMLSNLKKIFQNVCGSALLDLTLSLTFFIHALDQVAGLCI